MIRILWLEFLQCSRQLAKSPAFTVPAIAGLSLGIGAATAVFSVYYELLIRSTGFHEIQRLVAVWASDPRHAQEHVEACYSDLLEWKRRAPLLQDVALVSSVNLDFTIIGAGLPQQVDSTIVTGNFFRVIGARPAAGRLLRDDDDLPNAPNRVVISHRLWKTRFGGNPSIVGMQLHSAAASFTILGVASPEFDFPRGVDIWLPLHVGWPTVDQESRLRVFRSVALMKRSATIGELRAQMSVVARQMAEAAPPGAPDSVQVTPMLDEIFGNARVAIWTMGGAVLLVLLIACANASNLLLARAVLRRHELAVRAALGAGRGGLVRLLLIDGFVLATAAGAAGLVLAHIGVSVLVRVAPPDVPRMDQLALNTPVAIFGVVLALTTVVVFAVAPALWASHRDPYEALQQSAVRLSSSRSQTRMRGALIVLEVALSMVLLVGAGLLIRSFRELNRLDPGFDPSRILTFRITLEKPDQESRRAFYTQLLARLRSLPGTESAAAVLLRPLSGSTGWDSVYSVEGQSLEEQARNPNGNYEAISPAYFRTMGIRLKAGRDFTIADAANSPAVVILNESTARRHWPDRSAVGRHIRLGRDPRQPWLTVVGVVSDVRYREWEAVRPDFYVPYLQHAQHRSDFVVKTRGDIATLAAAVRRETAELDSGQAVSNFTTMEALVDRALSRSRFNALVIGALAACALLLAVIGLYGVLSHTVAQSRTEIGIRMAIGAGPWRIVRTIAGGGLRLALPGVVIGAIGACALSRLLATLLFRIGPVDPAVYAIAGLGLLVVAALACAAPAARAARLDPLHVLQRN